MIPAIRAIHAAAAWLAWYKCQACRGDSYHQAALGARKLAVVAAH
jgi:hypothetical protein